MTALEQLRAIYFNATRGTIQDDFGNAIDLFKQLTTDEDREKAAVFMEGIAEMRREWAADGRGKNAGKNVRTSKNNKNGKSARSARKPAGKPGGSDR